MNNINPIYKAQRLKCILRYLGLIIFLLIDVLVAADPLPQWWDCIDCIVPMHGNTSLSLQAQTDNKIKSCCFKCFLALYYRTLTYLSPPLEGFTADSKISITLLNSLTVPDITKGSGRSRSGVRIMTKVAL